MNKIIIGLLAPFTLILSTSNHATDYDERNLKQSCAKLSQYRKLGQKYYDQKNYKKALDQFQKQASWSDFCQSVGALLHKGFKGKVLLGASNLSDNLSMRSA
ncbi:MAG: hypothetical protein GAK29_00352 [Acinetobacter bereziniae]|uniref:Tetratricopeptide repeat protein n=1 Tax=Acinetobacter bereziniae TaxID=106648 RepID=A0A833PJ75_ACIBZ|nr:MAG: hypothetical protein GAK29_00352 [Acinetobacter bereziniae]